jgi:prevent-host-death family protein
VIRVGLKAARRDLLALVRAVARDGERIVLTRRGRPVAALLPADAIPALDLLARMLPSVADVARDLLAPDPQTLGLGPPPDPGAERALRSGLSGSAAPHPRRTPDGRPQQPRPRAP